jgi:DUF1365 family protein
VTTPPTYSGLYEGELRHVRLDATSHAFTYRVLMAHLDLDELPGALDAHPLWSARRPAPVRFRRADFHGDPAVPLDVAVRDTVEGQLGRRPTGPIRLLAHLRTWGWSFNPIAFYLVHQPEGDDLDVIVAEVTNTPWHERHAYVIPVGGPDLAERRRFPKAMHVSPFMDLDLDHSLAMSRPGADRWTIRMDDWRGPQRVFAASLDLRRLPLDRPTMGAALRRHPLPAQRVSAGIYREALRLRLRHAPFRHHPEKVGRTRSTVSLALPPAPSDRALSDLAPSPTPTPTPEPVRSPA